MATNLQNMNQDVVKPVAINSCIHFLIRPFATVLLFRNEDITTDIHEQASSEETKKDCQAKEIGDWN